MIDGLRMETKKFAIKVVKVFYYNQKIIGVRAPGKVLYNDRIYEFTRDNSFRLLDWGHGV
jgi:hypothetical protein